MKKNVTTSVRSSRVFELSRYMHSHISSNELRRELISPIPHGNCKKREKSLWNPKGGGHRSWDMAEGCRKRKDEGRWATWARMRMIKKEMRKWHPYWWNEHRHLEGNKPFKTWHFLTTAHHRKLAGWERFKRNDLFCKTHRDAGASASTTSGNVRQIKLQSN